MTIYYKPKSLICGVRWNDGLKMSFLKGKDLFRTWNSRSFPDRLFFLLLLSLTCRCWPVFCRSREYGSELIFLNGCAESLYSLMKELWTLGWNPHSGPDGNRLRTGTAHPQARWLQAGLCQKNFPCTSCLRICTESGTILCRYFFSRREFTNFLFICSSG